MKNFRKLDVWVKAYALALDVYRAMNTLPEKDHGLGDQLLDSARSIPVIIAAGSASDTDEEFRKFMMKAVRSVRELETYFLLARDLEYLTMESYELLSQQVEEVNRMLSGYVRRLKS